MAAFSKARAWVVSASAAIGLVALSASARADVLFDSLSSPNSGIVGDNPFIASVGFAASFDTGASAVRLTDVALLLNTTFFMPSDTFTVSLVGGVPLADVTFVNGLGLVFGSPLSDLGSVTLPISDLSAGLTIQHFSQFTNITLDPDAFYAISIHLNEQSTEDGATVGWGTTTDDSGPGVADGYNSSIITDNGFFPNKPTPPPNNGGPIFQMEVSAVATPEPSTWALMIVGLAGLGLLAYRRRPALATPA
jgi:PEP-CTERM motif